MSAEVSVANTIEITALAGGDESRVIKFTSGTTPAETVQGKPIIGNTAVTLDFGDIAAGSGYLLYLEALVGNVYVKLGVTSGTPVNTDSHLYILEGEGYTIPINPNATAMSGVRLVSDSATGQIKYILIGS
ncbi:MAG TPA: hypothetical protein ENI23_16735 [bacterium]|nr:hypothetical protein [bacterium]